MVDLGLQNGLVGNLQARATHAEVHAVHVDLTCMWLSLAHLRHVRILVLKQWHFYLNLLLAAPLVDGLGEAEESRVRTSRFFRDEVLVSVDVPSFDSTLVGALDVGSDLGVVRSHRVWCAQNRTRRCRDQLDVTSTGEEFIQVLAAEQN